ncbi:hypothetical protein RGU75_18525 [Glaciimonas sp. CA11.2]|nr:hypothetical protein [Glaciimonas sp. CA11.2]MDY7548211.1 hypothetical protein [Glaciimonas sp. CA11.2]
METPFRYADTRLKVRKEFTDSNLSLSASDQALPTPWDDACQSLALVNR